MWSDKLIDKKSRTLLKVLFYITISCSFYYKKKYLGFLDIIF